jgi:type II secretory pathway component PulK
MVLFIVALASILVVDLTYSTTLGGRTNSVALRQLQAEYLLKSAVSLSRALIKQDTTPEDSPQDPWAFFAQGRTIPGDLLQLPEPNIQVSLEIRPEESKIPLRALVPFSGGEPDKKWRDVIVRLFKTLGFDNDHEDVDTTGKLGKNRWFSSEEMVANLIDYQDSDQTSYDPGDFARGIESDLAEGDTFVNTRIQSISELATIPGFTPSRIRKMIPFVTAYGSSRININLAPNIVLQALSSQIDQTKANQIVAFRSDPKSGPFTEENRKAELGNIIGDENYDALSPMLSIGSNWFQVIAKIDYGTSIYFARAYLARSGVGALPRIKVFELF